MILIKLRDFCSYGCNSVGRMLGLGPSCRQFESGYPYSPWHPREDADNPIIANMDNYSVRENRVVLIRTIINTIIYSFTKTIIKSTQQSTQQLLIYDLINLFHS